MASTFVRSINRRSLSSLHSCVKPRAAPAAAAPRFGPAGSASQAASRASNPSIPARRFSSSSRCPSELGCCWGYLFPLHSAVAAARLNSCLSLAPRSCRALSQVVAAFLLFLEHQLLSLWLKGPDFLTPWTFCQRWKLLSHSNGLNSG